MNIQNVYDLRDYGLRIDCPEVQTGLIQKVLDRAKEEGGRVIFPKGEYVTGGLRFYSNMTLYFEAGARLLGSPDPSDYKVFRLPEDVVLHTDMDMLPAYFTGPNKPRSEYRRALLSAYGCHDIAIVGEGKDSVIDGRDCFDPEGEEGLRGPHGIFISNCRNVLLKDYTIRNSANFHHQMDTTEDVTAEGLQILGGHDGFHLHCCHRVSISDCIIHTGDDCVAGMNMTDITVKNCSLNTSCQFFRIGGSRIHVKDCRMFGPGIWPWRRSIMTSPNVFLPLTEGRHQVVSFMEYFASPDFPLPCSEDIVFEDCTAENFGQLLEYHFTGHSFAGCHFCSGTPLSNITFRNFTVRGLKKASTTSSSEEMPLRVFLQNVTCFGESGEPMEPFSEESVHLIISKE